MTSLHPPSFQRNDFSTCRKSREAGGCCATVPRGIPGGTVLATFVLTWLVDEPLPLSLAA